jgi:hypothetical protein
LAVEDDGKLDDHPGWVAFITQNGDRPFAVTVLDAIKVARAHLGMTEDERVAWRHVARALEDEAVFGRMCATHGEELVLRVRSLAARKRDELARRGN